MVKKKRIRGMIQAVWSLITNSNLSGFIQGRIFTGKSKQFCVPGLNCYSCPGALGACPIGALQAVVGSWKYKMSYYVLGFLMLIGALVGRFVCGWLCPFGWFQDLLHKIPFPKKIKTFKWDKPLRLLKYLILIVFVILLPLTAVDIVGQGMPQFCKWICPSGTLLGGWPLILTNTPLQDAIGWLFAWKNVILISVIVLSIIVYRPFCKYICPLGAIYSVFNPISFYRIQLDRKKCTGCGACSKVCKMGLDPTKTANHLECIRCGDCKHACPHKAIKMGFYRSKKNVQNMRTEF